MFRRSDLNGATVTASHKNVGATVMCTTIGNGNGVRVATVEHLMSAFAGLGIDNVLVEIDGPEVPIMDGSAAPFVFLIECAGIVEQTAPRRAIQVLKPIEVSDGERSASLSPSRGFSVSCEITYSHPLIGRQECFFEFSEGAYKREICRARTYGFLRDVDSLRERGFALGGSLENAVVLDDDAVVNEEGLRYADEPVRHKALDCIGDLYLAGGQILGHLDAVRTGHTMNHKLLRTLFETEDAWRSIALDDAALAPMPGWGAPPVAVSA
jgi:UDP-3-O-[3-hydroxymyristoyl] N-acetylglucosamine deacetylase